MNKGLIRIVEKFKDQKILVVGDLMIDRYLWSEVDRISSEAPVPIANVYKQTDTLGGAANTSNNLASLGVQVDLIGQIGNDVDGETLVKMLKKNKINTTGLIKNYNLPTIVKTRIMSGNHQLIRFDREKIQDIDGRAETVMLDYLKNNNKKYSTIIISDYAKGFVTEKIAKKIIKMARKDGILVLSDPTPGNFYKFAGSYIIKPNRKETESLIGRKIDNDLKNLEQIGFEVKNKLNTEVLIITLGKDGLAYFSKDGMVKIDTCAKEVYDVSGAGDSTIAGIAASLSAGATIKEAACIGNACAGIVVGKLGTTTCSSNELIDYLNNE